VRAYGVLNTIPEAGTSDPFRVSFDGGRVVVEGTIDTFDADRLARILAGSPSVPAALLDVARLEFIDVAGCRVIARWAGELRARGVPVEIRGASPLFHRVWDVLALDKVAPVAFAEAAA
jgi:anti-anti-sigma regulatory factor